MFNIYYESKYFYYREFSNCRQKGRKKVYVIILFHSWGNFKHFINRNIIIGYVYVFCVLFFKTSLIQNILINYHQIERDHYFEASTNI
jgi:hypothetical protein